MQSAREARWLDRTGQRWKVRAAYLTSVVQVSALISVFVVEDDNSRLTAFCVMGAALILLAMFVLSVRCRVCGEHVMIWAWNRRNTIGDLDRLETCPQCGARDDSDKPVNGQPAAARDGDGKAALSLDRVRQPWRPAWFVYVIAGMVGLWLLRWLMELVR